MHRIIRKAVLPLFVAGVALMGVAVASAEGPTYSGTAVKSVTATLVDTTGKSIGVVQLHEDSKGVVLVLVEAVGLTPGSHGVHIHESGSCEGPAFTSAGGHFNPDAKKQHGLSNPAGPHAGDLPGMDVIANGTVVYKQSTDRISTTAGPTNLFDKDGSSLIIHAGPDDQTTDPTGNSGARVACAVIAPGPGAPSAGTGSNWLADSGPIDPLALAGLGLVSLALGTLTLSVSRRRA